MRPKLPGTRSASAMRATTRHRGRRRRRLAGSTSAALLTLCACAAWLGGIGAAHAQAATHSAGQLENAPRSPTEAFEHLQQRRHRADEEVHRRLTATQVKQQEAHLSQRERQLLEHRRRLEEQQRQRQRQQEAAAERLRAEERQRQEQHRRLREQQMRQRQHVHPSQGQRSPQAAAAPPTREADRSDDRDAPPPTGIEPAPPETPQELAARIRADAMRSSAGSSAEHAARAKRLAAEEHERQMRMRQAGDARAAQVRQDKLREEREIQQRMMLEREQREEQLRLEQDRRRLEEQERLEQLRQEQERRRLEEQDRLEQMRQEQEQHERRREPPTSAAVEAHDAVAAAAALRAERDLLRDTVAALEARALALREERDALLRRNVADADEFNRRAAALEVERNEQARRHVADLEAARNEAATRGECVPRAEAPAAWSLPDALRRAALSARRAVASAMAGGAHRLLGEATARGWIGGEASAAGYGPASRARLEAAAAQAVDLIAACAAILGATVLLAVSTGDGRVTPRKRGSGAKRSASQRESRGEGAGVPEARRRGREHERRLADRLEEEDDAEGEEAVRWKTYSARQSPGGTRVVDVVPQTVMTSPERRLADVISTDASSGEGDVNSFSDGSFSDGSFGRCLSGRGCAPESTSPAAARAEAAAARAGALAAAAASPQGHRRRAVHPGDRAFGRPSPGGWFGYGSDRDLLDLSTHSDDLIESPSVVGKGGGRSAAGGTWVEDMGTPEFVGGGEASAVKSKRSSKVRRHERPGRAGEGGEGDWPFGRDAALAAAAVEGPIGGRGGATLRRKTAAMSTTLAPRSPRGISGRHPDEQRLAADKRARALAYSRSVKHGVAVELPTLHTRREEEIPKWGVKHADPFSPSGVIRTAPRTPQT